MGEDTKEGGLRYTNRRKAEAKTSTAAVTQESILEPLFLLGGRFLGAQRSIGSSRELVLELLNSTRRVDIFQLARKERMAFTANIDPQFLADTASRKGVPATAGHRSFNVIWMDLSFHDIRQLSLFSNHKYSSQAVPQ